MTSEDLHTVAPRDVIHFEQHPSGCTPWTIAETWDSPVEGRTVRARSERPGGGVPTLYAAHQDLPRYHLARDCERRAAERAVERQAVQRRAS
jgi:hypothetical protein